VSLNRGAEASLGGVARKRPGREAGRSLSDFRAGSWPMARRRAYRGRSLIDGLLLKPKFLRAVH
jgi:hypothetical protein